MNNKTFRLFVSSTFNDFHKEREILNQQIAKELDEYCKQFGYNFQIIDLRWGINNESALNQKTLEICLEEVKRCRILSPKPNFLLMIGNRYGWMPIPSLVEQYEFETILSKCSNDQKSLLLKWYILNENRKPPHYQLKTRTGIYVKDTVWAEIEDNIKSVLQSVLPLCSFSTDMLLKYKTSATEQEILEGVFYEGSDSTNAIAVFREGGDLEAYDSEKIISLKNRIEKKMAADNCEGSVLHLNFSNDYYDLFHQKICDNLKNNIDKEIKRLEGFTTSSSAVFVADLFRDAIENVYYRDNELSEINRFIESKTENILFIFGESGCGKTTLLAKAISQASKDVFCLFYGVDESSYSLFTASAKICTEICEKYNILNKVQLEQNNIAKNFYNTLSAIPKEAELVIVLDGIESMNDIDDVKEQILPYNIQNNIKFIISSSEKNIIHIVTTSYKLLEISGFDSAHATSVLTNYLDNHNFCLSNNKQKALCKDVLSKGANPLLVKLMANYCKDWKSTDYDIKLSDSEEGIIADFIESMYLYDGHNENLVLYALAIIAAAPFGITEYEIQKILFSIPEIQLYFNSEKHHDYSGDLLPFAIWSRLCYDLSYIISFSFFDGEIVVKFAHQIIYKVIKHVYSELFDKAQKKLIDYYKDAPNYLTNKSIIPNLRKCKALPLMLKSTRQTNELYNLYSDVGFIDACIKSEELDNTIFNLIYLKNNCTLWNDNSENLLHTLMSNYLTLSVYRNELYNVLSFIPCKPTIEREETYTLPNSHYFHISPHSKVAYNESTDEIAFFTNGYVYVCDYSTSIEKHKIFVGSDDWFETSVNELLWISSNELIIIINNKEMLLYKIEKENLTLNTLIEFNSEVTNIQVCNSLRLIFYLSKKGIVCQEIDTKKTSYIIPLKKSAIFFEAPFEVIEMSKSLCVKTNNKQLAYYNIETGALIHTKRIAKHKQLNKVEQIKHFSEDNYILYTTPKLFALCRHGNITFICPPAITGIKECITGYTYMIIAYDNGILVLNLVDKTTMFYAVNQEYSVLWKTKDSSVLIVSQGAVTEFSLSTFNSVDCLKDSLFFDNNIIEKGTIKNKALLNELRSLATSVYYSMNNNLNLRYKCWLASGLTHQKEQNSATIYIESQKGYVAIAYETADTIVVNTDICSFEIDNLHLAFDNNILKMDFSDDSKWLLIWMNQQLLVFNLTNNKKYIDLNLKKTPLKHVEYSNNNTELLLTLPSNKVLSINLNKTKKHLRIQGLLEKNTNECFAFPFVTTYSGDSNNNRCVFTLINHKTFIKTIPSKWFLYIGAYQTDDLMINYNKGYFFTKDNSKYESRGFDFIRSTDLERAMDSTSLTGYLREKNNLFSKLFLINNGYAVLIHIPTNSIIVLDVINHRVISAIKHMSPIIGGKQIDNNSICVFSNQMPYQCKYRINIPERDNSD